MSNNDDGRGTEFSGKELDELARAFDNGDIETEPGTATIIETDDSSRTSTLSIRMPTWMISALKSAAEDRGVGATVLAREWIAERLAAEGDVPDESTVRVTDLLQWLTAKVEQSRASRVEPHEHPDEPTGSWRSR